MSAKIANLIAIETGILIGIISWLVYSKLPSQPETTALPEGRSSASVDVSPLNQIASESTERSQRFSTAAYDPEREQARLMAEREASLQSYYRTLARDWSSTPRTQKNEVLPVDTSTYAVPEETEVVSSEYPIAPPTVLYYAPAALQNVVVADTGHLRNRCRSPHRRDGTRMNPRSCPPPANIRPNTRKVVSPPNPGTPPSPAVDESKPRQTIAQPTFNGRSQKRATSPTSTGSTRRFVSAP
jgi:hypothetical protein